MMNAPDPAAPLAAALSELANALQVALPIGARIRERADALAQDAERLDVTLTRAADAVRTLQPRAEGEGDGR